MPPRGPLLVLFLIWECGCASFVGFLVSFSVGRLVFFFFFFFFSGTVGCVSPCMSFLDLASSCLRSRLLSKPSLNWRVASTLERTLHLVLRRSLYCLSVFLNPRFSSPFLLPRFPLILDTDSPRVPFSLRPSYPPFDLRFPSVSRLFNPDPCLPFIDPPQCCPFLSASFSLPFLRPGFLRCAPYRDFFTGMTRSPSL